MVSLEESMTPFLLVSIRFFAYMEIKNLKINIVEKEVNTSINCHLIF
jgi:hypothetical protein